MARISCKWLEENYSKSEVMIPMRDGVRLYTAIYSPLGRADKRPLLLMRTPFPLQPYGQGRMASNLRKSLYNFVEAGYIIVQQNVRGCYLSEGKFENVRPGDQESLDCYDSVEWLIANTFCNGSVGVKGMSYPGFYATCAALSLHSAIKAVSPQAPVTDWFIGDDLHHNGALMLYDCYHFGLFFFRKRPRPGWRVLPTRHEECEDVYNFFLEKGTVAQTMSGLARRNDFWNEIASHPHYDDFWQKRDASKALSRLADLEQRPALLFVGGTFDAEDCYGPQKCFRVLDSGKYREDLYLVLGPWAHGSWLKKEFDHLADASLGKGLSQWFMDTIEFPFFEWYLEGKGEKPMDKVQIFTSEAVSYTEDIEDDNCMVLGAESWPLENSCESRWHLCSDGSLDPTESEDFPGSLTSSAEEEHILSYISNPFTPVPATEPSPYISKDYMAADQRFVSRRKDVLCFKSRKLRKILVAAGPVKVSLDLAVSTSDADIVVKLIDVRPDGYQMLVRSGIMPLRYRESLSKPLACVAGEKMRIEFNMCDIAHVFKPGHRIMVQIQSSMFPLFAMNPQQYMNNPYLAEDKDYQVCEVSLYTESSFISITVPS